MPPSTKIRVRFAVEYDESAEKIAAVLEALGYEAIRDLDQSSSQSGLRWPVTRLAEQARLTERERELVELVLQGKRNTEIAQQLRIGKATVKWHIHNIFSKTGAANRETLLREALHLGGLIPRQPTEEARVDILNVEKIRQTELGRAWLAAFVPRVWAALPQEARERLRWSRCDARPLQCAQMFISAGVEPAEQAADSLLTEIGLLGDPLTVLDLRSRVGPGRWLTPLGVEVYMYGRRLQNQNRSRD